MVKKLTVDIEEQSIEYYGYPPNTGEKEMKEKTQDAQWAIHGDSFSPTGPTTKKLQPGLYKIEESNSLGVYLKEISINTGDLVKFPGTNCDAIVDDIHKFWSCKEKYLKIRQSYKRGILLHGKGGAGKTSTLNLVMKDLIKNDGIVIKFESPYLFDRILHKLRKIEPDRNIVVLMEDIESIIQEYDESTILNILDGVSSYENIVYLATTNYPEKLLGRITNRPSRFDRVFSFDVPNDETRRIYLENLVSNYQSDGKTKIDIDINAWIKDTKTLTIAHIKELFLSVYVFNYDYNETLRLLKDMKTRKVSKDDEESSGKLGF